MYDLQRCAGLTLPAVSWLARRSLGHSGLAPWIFPVSGQTVVSSRNRKGRKKENDARSCAAAMSLKKKKSRAGTVVIMSAWVAEAYSSPREQRANNRMSMGQNIGHLGENRGDHEF